MRSGRYSEAARDTESALAIMAADGVPETTSAVRYLDLGHAKMMLGDYGAARACFERYLAIAQEAEDPLELFSTYSHLGALALHEARFDDALDLLERATALSKHDDLFLNGERVCNIGSAHRGLGNLRKALTCQRQALALMQDCGSAFGECDTRIELAVTLHQAGQDAEAHDHLKHALDIAERLDLQPQKAKALETLAAIRTLKV